MRRKDRQVEDVFEILEMIKACSVCRIAMVDEGKPYVLPMNFGYSFEDGSLTLFFHGALAGRKIDILQKSPEVCFEMDVMDELIRAEAACNFSCSYRSVIGFGRAEFLTSKEEKIFALQKIMEHVAGAGSYHFPDAQLSHVAVFSVTTKDFTGKSNPKK